MSSWQLWALMSAAFAALTAIFANGLVPGRTASRATPGPECLTAAVLSVLPELLIKAQAEGIKRYYEDKAMAVKAYAVYDPQTPADVERLYDHDRKSESYERVPYVLAPAVQWIVEHQADPQVGARLKAYDFHKVIDNSVVERLVKEHFFENLFGPGIKAEEDKKAKLAFK